MAILKQPILKAYLTLEHRDKTGKVIKRFSGLSHSWTENYYVYVLCQASGVKCAESLYGLEYYDTSAAKVSDAQPMWPYYQSSGLWNDITVATQNQGVVIGRGSTVEVPTSTSLATIIAHGTGTNQMSREVNILNFQKVLLTYKSTISRIFTNNSGSAIKVKETGLYGYFKAPSAFDYRTVLLNRDLITPMNIQAGDSMYVAYTIELTFPN